MRVDLDDIRNLAENFREKKFTGHAKIDNKLREYEKKWNGHHPYYAFFRALTDMLRPETVVEIGAWQGTCAACFALGGNSPQVITVDHYSDPGDDEHLKAAIDTCEELDNVTIIQGCSTERVFKEKPKSRNAYPLILEELDGKSIDILYIDGWHVGEMAYADYTTYLPHLSDEALIICDDLVFGDSAAISGMKWFWDQIPGEKMILGWTHPGFPQGFVKKVKGGVR